MHIKQTCNLLKDNMPNLKKLVSCWWKFLSENSVFGDEIFNIQLTLAISNSLISNNRLSRITAYLEVKILSLLKHKNLTTGKKKLWKRGEIAPKEQFLLFSTIFSIYLTSRVQLHIYLLNVVNRISFSPNSANLICWSTDISKYFKESLGIWVTRVDCIYIGVFS